MSGNRGHLNAAERRDNTKSFSFRQEGTRLGEGGNLEICREGPCEGLLTKSLQVQYQEMGVSAKGF